MKSIFTIIIAIFAATFTFANNGNPVKGTSAVTVIALPIDNNNDDEAEMSVAMDAVLGNLISNNTMATTATTMDNATILTVTSNEITISNRFAVYTFGETITSDNIAPVAAAMETITLDAEEL